MYRTIIEIRLLPCSGFVEASFAYRLPFSTVFPSSICNYTKVAGLVRNYTGSKTNQWSASDGAHIEKAGTTEDILLQLQFLGPSFTSTQ